VEVVLGGGVRRDVLVAQPRREEGRVRGLPVVAPGVGIVLALVEGVFDAVGGGSEGRYPGAVLVGCVVVGRDAAVLEDG
jgi:hypothetical protein